MDHFRISEDTVKCTDDKYIEKTVERFYGRAGRLENDLQRYEKYDSFSQMFLVVFSIIIPI